MKLFWYDGLNEQPKFDGVPAGELLGDKDINGSLFIGDKGMVTTGCYGERTRLVPAEKMKDYKLPPPAADALARPLPRLDPRLQGRRSGVLELQRCRRRSSQWMLLGVIAMQFEGKLEWDAAKMRFTNNNEANQYLKPKFRKGWKMA